MNNYTCAICHNDETSYYLLWANQYGRGKRYFCRVCGGMTDIKYTANFPEGRVYRTHPMKDDLPRLWWQPAEQLPIFCVRCGSKLNPETDHMIRHNPHCAPCCGACIDDVFEETRKHFSMWPSDYVGGWLWDNKRWVRVKLYAREVK